ncbi:MAG: succinate dehydrogenase flavoprotein subunit [Deltaproteobacteria bacterium]|nr:MAG: succinate dehydrogenase flavoprotein subunit [Deltaproteobacteria bacterium]
MSEKKIIIVGGGLAGLMATVKAAEQHTKVDLFSLMPVKRSHSVCAQGGINAAVNTKGEGDSPAVHFDDTIYGGDFLANQTPVKEMCENAPAIIHMFDRMGVMFNRTPEGLLDFRRFGGTRHHRTAYAGATTGQQLLYALDEQVRRYEAAGLVTKYEGWEFLSAILDDAGTCHGITAMEFTSGEVRSFGASAVILATGGPGIVFGKSTNSVINTGAAAVGVYLQGATYANGEFIQVHPTAIPGDDKLRLMSESARGEGGRVWVPKDGKPWYFLEEKYPAYGNLVPRDIATREIFDVCVNQGLGVDGKMQVYLDLTEKTPEFLEVKLGGILEIYRKFTGADPAKVPMKVFPAVHYSMGGLWVDFNQMTSLPGLFAAGECEYQYHGANRLGANSLLSCIHGGGVAAAKALEFIEGSENGNIKADMELERIRLEENFADIRKMDGLENPYRLHDELGELMTSNVTVVRDNRRLDETLTAIKGLKERYREIGLADTGRALNQSLQFTRQLHHMLELAEVITLGARMRDESRGAHYKPEFPERDDEHFLKTTLANFTGDGPTISYEEVDTQYIEPRPRNYAAAS